MKTAKTVRDYALAMNVAIMVNQFDAGQTWTLSHHQGATLRASYEWGEEDAFFLRLTRWLDDQPWPGSDDPRVQMHGTYTDRRFIQS